MQSSDMTTQYRVLIIDNDDIPRKVHSHFLTKLGYHVDPAKNTEEALAFIESSFYYKIIFLDIQSSYIDYEKIIEKIRSAEDNEKRDICIILTGYSEERLISKYKYYCVNDILVKDGNREALEEILKLYAPNVGDKNDDEKSK